MKNSSRYVIRRAESLVTASKAQPWSGSDAGLKILEKGERFVAELPVYDLPATASFLARLVYWPIVEDAHQLPDGRLFVRWLDFSSFEILTVDQFLAALAARGREAILTEDDIRPELIRQYREALAASHPA